MTANGNIVATGRPDFGPDRPGRLHRMLDWAIFPASVGIFASVLAALAYSILPIKHELEELQTALGRAGFGFGSGAELLQVIASFLSVAAATVYKSRE